MEEQQLDDKTLVNQPLDESIQKAIFDHQSKELSLYQKIAKAKEMVGVVKKEGKVSFKNTNYNYQRAEDIEIAVRDACQKVGILILLVHNDHVIHNPIM